MNRIATGVDLVDIDQTSTMLGGEAGANFRDTCWTTAEQNECGGRVDRLSTRWAAKEATMKALGMGFGDIDPLAVEVVTDEDGRPQLRLHGPAAERARRLGLTTWSVSLSHEGSMAIALVVAVGHAA